MAMPRLTTIRYVYGLSPDYIVALVKTASYGQMPVLRDAICKHVDAVTSIRIHIPVSKTGAPHAQTIRLCGHADTRIQNFPAGIPRVIPHASMRTRFLLVQDCARGKILA